MKKTFSLLILVFFLTGCTGQTSLNDQNNPDIDNQNIINKEEGGNQQEIINNNEEKNMSEENTNQEEVVEETTVDMKSEELVKVYSKAIIKTSAGDITVKFYNNDSPKTVANFLKLANAGFYNETLFHRVMKDFMIQAGDPNSKDANWSTHGMGGPGYMFDDEFNDNKLVKGSLAMANSGANTNGSQFFIVTTESTPWLDGKHTNFGYVAEGMDIVEKIEKVKTNENDHPLEDVMINGIELLK